MTDAATQYHLQNYERLAQFTPDLIRTEVLNDDGTLVFRAQDVCDALGALDYHAAMLSIDPGEVVMFSHPDTSALGMRYACVTREGAYQLHDSVRDLGDSLEDAGRIECASKVYHWVLGRCDEHDREPA